MHIWQTLTRAIALHPDQLAVVDGERRLSYRELGDRAARLAAWLSERGLGRGDRLAVLEVNSHVFLEAYYAAAAAGLVLVPLNWRLAAPELGAILRDSGASWLVARADFADRVDGALEGATALRGVLWVGGAPRAPRLPAYAYEELAGGATFSPVAIAPDELAHLYYTSGTTGRPKGVMLTHRNVCTHALAAIAELGLHDGDVWGHIAPMFHLADAWASFAVTWAGGRHVMVPAFSAEAALDAIDRGRVSVTNLIPTMLTLMLKHPRARTADLSSLRLLLSGGAPIAPELVRQVLEVLGCEYYQTYGLTETSPYLTLSRPGARHAALPPEALLALKAKTGRPFLGVELRVVDEGGRDVPADDRAVGEIWARGETVTPGYWNLPDETDRAFCDGWLRTGDLATIDADGYLTIVDRKKDMIISGGENVYSIEVENALYLHAAVLEAAVFGLRDEVWGERVVAAVVLCPEGRASEEELQAWCRERLAGYKVPRRIVFVDQLPRTGSGKISKRALRDRLAGEVTDPEGTTPGGPRP